MIILCMGYDVSHVFNEMFMTMFYGMLTGRYGTWNQLHSCDLGQSIVNRGWNTDVMGNNRDVRGI